jgi:pimeloyl-ACP methyl ester carboxylesterase
MPAAPTVTLPLPSGGFLRGTVDRTGGPCSVLYVHGFGSDRKGVKAEAVRTVCARRKWSFAAFDFRGHGDSSGAMTDLRGSGLQADLEAVREWLAGRGVRRLFLVGSSMGGWAGAWFALGHPEEVAALALIAPAFRFLQRRWEAAAEEDRRSWERTGRLRFRNQWLDVELGYGLVAERDAFDPDKLADGWRTPALIFHGMRDEAVPWRDTLALVERAAYPGIETRLLRGGDHRLQEYAGEMAEESCRFFASWWE